MVAIEGETQTARLRPGSLTAAAVRTYPRRSDRNKVARLQEDAVVHAREGRLDEAQQLFEMALEVDPRNADTLHDLGLLHAKQGQADMAQRLWERGLEADPLHLPTNHNLGTLHQTLGRHAEARRLLERAAVRAGAGSHSAT